MTLVFRSFRGVFSMDRAGMAIAFAASLALLYLAVPRTVAGFITAPSYRTLQDIQKGGAIDDAALVSLVESRRRAAGWVESGRYWSDLAMAEFLLADTGGASGDRNRIMLASYSLEAALALSPADPHGWTRRAYAELLLNGPSEVTASALVMSVLTARYEPDLMFVRLELCLLSWPHFSLEDRELVEDQISLAWRQSPDRVLDLAAVVGGLSVVRGALAGSPDSLAEMERRLER